MRKWLLFALLFAALAFPSAANAQGITKLKAINIGLWAEYDQPSMLVIHEFVVEDNTPLPVQVRLRFPKDGNLTAVAYTDSTGKLINATYTGPEEQGDWQTVTLSVTSTAPHRIEYYEPLTRQGNQRSFNFQWFGDYAADEFNVTIQLPADSTKVLSSPPFTNTVTTDDGSHLIGQITRGSVTMGQSAEYKIQYERTSETVTNASNPANIQPAEPIGANTAGRVSIDNLPWIIGGFGLALIGLALFFYFRSSQTPEQRSRRRRRRGTPAEEESGEEAYCHECGTRAHAGDRFCRTCGSKLRT